MTTELKSLVLQKVNDIPKGKITTYGTIAAQVGTSARVIGYILSGLTDEETAQVPWYRVVAKDGTISSLKLGYRGVLQRETLILEGYEVVDDKVNMEKHYV